MNMKNESFSKTQKLKKKICIGLAGLAAVVLIAALGANFLLFSNAGLFHRQTAEVTWTNPSLEDVVKDYDVIVVGGEPEGVSAAVSAARQGLSVLLLEDDEALGGLMTMGKLNFIDMCYGRDGTLLTRGIFQEFYDGVGGTAFDIVEAKNQFLTMVTDEPTLTLRTNASLIKPALEDPSDEEKEAGALPRIAGVWVRDNGVLTKYTARRIIDATADADLAALAGVPYTYGGEDIGEAGRQMGVTLVFELSGVNWREVFYHLNFQRLRGMLSGGSTEMGATLKTAWGYAEEGYGYTPKDEMMRLRGFNAARQKSGNVLINALIIFDVDPLDEAGRRQAMRRAEAELAYLVPYVRENFTGFEKAALAGVADQLYVRETRHILGEYTLSIDDVLENRDSDQKIAIGSYPADIQPTAEQTWGTVVGNPDRYAVPFGCLIPLEVDHLLVVGRSASFSSLAASSARVIPLGMACGEAAGVACAYSIENGLDFRRMNTDAGAMAAVQERLKAQGAYLEDFVIHEAFMDHWAYPGVRVLRSLGLLDGGYSNNYNLEAAMEKWRFQYYLNGVFKKAGLHMPAVEVSAAPTNEEILRAAATGVLMLELEKGVYDFNSAWEADSSLTPQSYVTELAAQFSYEDLFRLFTEDAFVDPLLLELFSGDTSGKAAGGASADASGDITASRAAGDDAFSAVQVPPINPAAVIDGELYPYFKDPAKVPQAAETILFLARLYTCIITSPERLQ
ncbi:MAG: FAD-dependent oxidoreductase [Peptococcaceae bacterium]|nr:FAD-dependent oxidoreductase [Peptococcaceae bacterium]